MDTNLILELPTDVRTIRHAVDYVMCRCASGRWESRELDLNLRVGLTEALTNAMLYGNGQDPSKSVRIELVLGERSITARIMDEGSGFDPAKLPDPTISRNLQKPSGSGIFLMRQLLDEVHFNKEGNCVTLVLHLEPELGLGGGAPA